MPKATMLLPPADARRAHATASDFTTAFPVIRGTIITFDGQRVDTSGDCWRWRSRPDAGSRQSVNFKVLVTKDLVVPESVHVLRWWTAHLLATRKGGSVKRSLESVRHFLLWREQRMRELGRNYEPLDFGELTAAELIDYNEALLATGSPMRSAHFSDMRRMLRAVAARAGEQMQSGLVDRINSVRALRARQGHAVRTQDPRKGALTRGEVNALRAGANEGHGTELQRTLLRLCLETGMYGDAISDLRATEIRHEYLEELDRATGRMKRVRQWILDRPRVKKGTQHRETRELYVTATLGEALHERSRRGEFLFPEVRTNDPNGEIRSELTDYAGKLRIPNERTGGRLRLSTRRFRYTLGTELAADGHEPETIANILDHGHVKEAKAYIEVSRRLVERVNAMIAPEAERLLKRFRGRVEGQEEPRNRDLPVILNQGPSLDSDGGLSGIGGCGAGTLCGLAWPLSCYACDRFIAWADADHEGVLANLVERRTLFEAHGDTRVARQLDEVVLAVQDVIAEVERRRAEVAP